MFGNYSRILFLLAGMLFLILASSCNPDPEPPAPFEITFDFVSDPSPALNSNYRIEWTYSDESRLADQYVELKSLTLEGQLASQFFGCPPVEFRPEGLPEPGDCLPENQLADNMFGNSDRAFVGTFTGPVVFNLVAQDELSGGWTRKSFVLLLPDSFFRTGPVELSNAGYPFLAAGASAVKGLEFMNYFGIYENIDGSPGDGVIDDLAQPPLSAFATGGPFFFASSSRPEEALSFGYQRGSSFPQLDAGFLETPVGQGFVEQRTHANAVVFAGTIYLGQNFEAVTVKTDAGDVSLPVFEKLPVGVQIGDGPRKNTFIDEVLFVQIDLRSSIPIATATPLVSNVRFGNIGQGLVMCTFGCEFTPVTPSITNPQVVVNPLGPGQVGTTGGSIDQAGVAFQVTTANGDFLIPAAATLDAITWQGVPFYEDTEFAALAGLLP